MLGEIEKPSPLYLVIGRLLGAEDGDVAVSHEVAPVLDEVVVELVDPPCLVRGQRLADLFKLGLQTFDLRFDVVVSQEGHLEELLQAEREFLVDT